MILYFSGTGNSGYAARRIADGLGKPLLCLNDRIRAGDTAPVETGERLVIVTPTYAWRIPRIVGDDPQQNPHQNGIGNCAGKSVR